MLLGVQAVGAIVGAVLAYLIKESVSGDDYGAGVWQRPSDKQFVSHAEGKFRWLFALIATSVAGAIIVPEIIPVLIDFVRDSSPLVVGGAALVAGGFLDLFYRKVVLS